ncbi:zeta toxin family protein [Cupriavidus sp. CuC1]|uniref:zeta toxin family protein n=1 Tax=Cupriavidus sp. CuC1 TaxID=3373131 RepID=UPI0037D2D262
MARPVLYVLAGVNGAGKSSIGGYLLARAGLAWFNPDTFARELRAATGCAQEDANAAAWHEGVRRLDQAVSEERTYAFETTLGGNSVPARIRAATQSHDVIIWFCGLASADQHVARVKARVTMGGHDIPEDKIRERCTTSPANLIALMPHLAHLQVYDNSIDAAPGDAVPDPLLLLEMSYGKLSWPTSPQDLRRTPEWAKPIVEAALAL